MTTNPNSDNQPTDIDLDAMVDRALEGLNLNGTETGLRDKLLAKLPAAIAGERLNRDVRRQLERQAVPDFDAHFKTGVELRDQARIEVDHYLIENVIDYESTTLVTAPTNAGGSTLMLHAAFCLLTGEPFLGLFPVEPGEFVVVWVNPEEKETTPGIRLAAMGQPTTS